MLRYAVQRLEQQQQQLVPQSNSTSRTIDSVRINGYIFAHDSPKNSYQD